LITAEAQLITAERQIAAAHTRLAAADRCRFTSADNSGLTPAC
jgi:hypothetical protein